MATGSNTSHTEISSVENSGSCGSGKSGGAWNQVVRRVSEPIAFISSSAPAQSTAVIEPVSAEVEEESGAECGNGNAGSKKPAWKKQPSNGAMEVEPVMGAHSWPALSETTRGSSFSSKSSSDSLKGLADGSSLSLPQGTGAANSSSQKQVSNRGNQNSSSNNSAPTRQRSLKRNNSHSSSNGGLSQPPPPPSPGPIVESNSNNPSPRDHTQKSGFGSQSHAGNDHPHPRGSFKHRNGNSHPRGDGSHHHNYGGRRDHDRGNQEWNSYWNFNGRDAHMQPRVVQRFMRHAPPPPPPPPSSTPFIPPTLMRPFGNPVGFSDFASHIYYVPAAPPEALRGVPFVAPIPHHPVFFPPPDPQLHSRIVNQIDYYFSNENLIKDTYLRQNMNDQGWVPIRLIAGFNKVSLLTDNIQLILDALRSSTVVEVQGDRIRKRNDWKRWIIPSGQFSNLSSPQSQGKSGIDMLAANIQSISLDQKSVHHSRSSSGDSSNQSHL